MLRVLTLATLFAVSGCATTTQIVSTPPGATVYDDRGAELGKTPYTYSTKMWLWEDESVELRKSGYQNKRVTLKRSELNTVPMIGGIATAFLCSWTGIGLVGGVLWILADGMTLPDETSVTLQGGGSAKAPVPAAKKEEGTAAVSDY